MNVCDCLTRCFWPPSVSTDESVSPNEEPAPETAGNADADLENPSHEPIPLAQAGTQAGAEDSPPPQILNLKITVEPPGLPAALLQILSEPISSPPMTPYASSSDTSEEEAEGRGVFNNYDEEFPALDESIF